MLSFSFQFWTNLWTQLYSLINKKCFGKLSRDKMKIQVLTFFSSHFSIICFISCQYHCYPCKRHVSGFCDSFRNRFIIRYASYLHCKLARNPLLITSVQRHPSFFYVLSNITSMHCETIIIHDNTIKSNNYSTKVSFNAFLFNLNNIMLCFIVNDCWIDRAWVLLYGNQNALNLMVNSLVASSVQRTNF